ncbi:hypothetical protein [Methylocaldum sp. GT1TLB]|uniref:hypothetical protein n=1 Tax=Methylocaldum sp. GT1TLB TaxID=3438965 RepID=UPI003DA0D9CE
MMQKGTYFLAFLLVMICPLSSHAGGAFGNWSESFQVHGFLEQGFVATSGNQFYGNSRHGSFDLTQVGLNAAARPFNNVRFAVQGLYRRAGEQIPEELRLDYGLMDVTALDHPGFRSGVRLGRVKLPLGLYNESRDAPFTRPSIFLPQSLYFDRTRNVGMATDGAQFYTDFSSPFGNFSFKANLGASIPDNSLEFNVFGGSNRPGKFIGDFSAATQLAYDYSGGLIRVVFSAAWLISDYDKQSDPIIDSGEFEYQPYGLGIQYNGESLSLASEYSIRNIRFENFGRFLPDNEYNGEGYYFQAGYKINHYIELIGRYDVFYTDVSDRYGKKYEVRTGIPGSFFFAKDWMAALRFNIIDNFMIRAEYHRVHGAGWVSLAENRNVRELERDWDLFAIEAAYQF